MATGILGACVRCILRLTGVRDWELYRQPTAAIASTLASPPSLSDSPCSVCLGILQLAENEEVVKRITDYVAQENYDCPSFNLSVSLPAAIAVRQQTMLAHMSQSNDRFMTGKSDLPEVKEALKWTLGPRLETSLGKIVDYQSPLQLKLAFEHNQTRLDHKFLSNIPEANFKIKHHNGGEEDSNASVTEAVRRVPLSILRKHVECPPHAPAEFSQLSQVHLERESVFVAGRYNKFSRTLSQSQWVVDNKRMTSTSVAELIGNPVKDVFRADDVKFSSSGREDVDVRMLGSGRPFVLELASARTASCSRSVMAQLQKRINDGAQDLVLVHDLQIVSKTDVQVLKDGEENKKKTYSCVVWCSRDLTEEDTAKLNAISDMAVQQNTPMRVLHRRTASVRTKVIHEIRTHIVNRRFLQMELTTQAGTYVKEFVHGDLGRTLPNIGSLLGCHADILQLDVVEIHLDWPPRVPL